MPGWTLVFAFLAMLGGSLLVADGPAAGLVSTKLATIVFTVLFLASVLTSYARGRA